MLIFKVLYRLIQGIIGGLGLSVISLIIVVFYTTIPNELFTKLEVKPVLAKADVIVVLGAGVTQDGWPSRFSIERTVKGTLLYKKGYSNKIIFSGGWDHDGYIDSATAMATVAKDLGVKQSDIIIEDKSHDTHENAVFSVDIMKRKSFNTVLLVTSESHMRRSFAVFKKLGVNVYPVPVEEELINPELNWKAKFHNFSILYQFFYESAGIIKYKQRGWI